MQEAVFSSLSVDNMGSEQSDLKVSYAHSVAYSGVKPAPDTGLTGWLECVRIPVVATFVLPDT